MAIIQYQSRVGIGSVPRPISHRDDLTHLRFAETLTLCFFSWFGFYFIETKLQRLSKLCVKWKLALSEGFEPLLTKQSMLESGVLWPPSAAQSCFLFTFGFQLCFPDLNLYVCLVFGGLTTLGLGSCRRVLR